MHSRFEFAWFGRSWGSLVTVESRLKSRPVLGLDISATAVRVVELSRVGVSYRVESYAVEPLPADAIGEQHLADVETAGVAVRRAYQRCGSRLKSAAVAIDAANAIIRTLQLPAGLSSREQEEQVEVLAARHIPYPLEEVAWDYEVLGPSLQPPGSEDVLLVAARRDHIEHRQAILEIAGLEARVMDCEVFALENAYGLVRGQIANGASVTAFANFGTASTNFSFFDGKRIVYTREQAFGSRQLVDEIMRRYDLSYEDAVADLRQGDLPRDYREEVLDPFVTDMALQTNRALQFFLASTSEHASVDQVVLCGSSAAIPGAAERIASQIGKPTVAANPLAELELGERVRAQGIERDAPALMVACGLALRSFD
ncbi:MAG TPA: type IV pilus assembly protein PilM [Gammaproteobacteria bacterium]|nr:type IV pilus assembly protein PilM [Gammaproteobacteria bacterium]